MKDKEFKAKNKDSDFSKKVTSDTVFERQHIQENEVRPVSTSDRNKRYQQGAAEMQRTEYTQTEQDGYSADNTEPERSEVIQTDKTDIPKQDYTPPTQSHTSGVSDIVRHSARKRQYQKHHTPETATADTVPVPEPTQAATAEQSTPIPPKENDKYNFQDAVHNSDEAFDRVDGNTDFQLGGQSETVSPTETKPADEKKQARKKALQKKRVKEDKTGKYDIQEAVSKSETAFERTEPKEDFSFGKDKDIPFERKKDFGDTKADKSHQAKRDTKINQASPKSGDTKTDGKQKKKASRLKFEEDKKPRSPLYKAEPVKTAVMTAAANKVHSKVSENGDNNSAVEAAHGAERQGERILRAGNNTRRSLSDKREAAKTERRQRLHFENGDTETKKSTDTVKTSDKKSKSASKKATQKKAAQKKQIKKNYQKQKNVEKQAERTKKAAAKAKEAAKATYEFVKRHWKVLLIVLGVIVVFGFIASTVSSCSVMFSSGFNSIMTSSYLAEDEDIYAAEDYYKGLESDLRSEIDNIERDHSGYDEYKYNLAQIGHNPYELISYLTAAYMDFVFDDIKPELDALFSQQYILTLTEETETRTDSEGNETEYKILNVTLVNKNISMLANTYLDEEQRELYGIYL